MIRFLATLVIVLLTTGVQARASKARATAMHPDCNRLWPCIAPYASTPEQVRVTRGRYIARQIGIGGPNVKRAAKLPKRGLVGQVRPLLGQVASSLGVPSPSIGYTIARPLRFIAGRLICAVNVNAALAERGIQGTGSALARSYDNWGHASGPVPGAVAVTDRRGGGHVAIVSRVEGGRVFVWNATGGRKGWREIEYTNMRARYRVATQ